MRKTYYLTPIEFNEFRRLWPPDAGVAFAFWRQVAVARKLDPKTVISDGATFTALPEGHGQHWCWPLPLKCKKQPTYKD